MRANTSVKYSLFLIFLVLGHEFSLAYRLHDPLSQRRLSEEALKRPAFKAPTVNEPLRYGEAIKEFQDKRSENQTAVEVVKPEKRWVAAVALGVSIGISLAGIGIDVWLKLGTCCSPYPEICRYRDEFKKIQKRIIPLFDKVDFAALTAKNTLEDITQTNYRLIEIWNDMKRIRDLKVKLLTRLSSSTIKQFNTKWAEIEKQLKNANETVRHLTYAQISVEFSSFMDDYKTALLGFTPLLTYGLALVAIPAFRAYKKHSLNKEIARLSTGESYKQLVTARHTKAAKILGVQNLNQHIQSTAKARNDARFRTGKYTKFVNGISIVSTVISLGVEIYAAFVKITQCRDTVRDKAKKGLDDIKKGDKTLTSVYKNVSDYISYIDKKGVQYLRGQLASEQVLVELNHIWKLVKGAGKQAQSKNLTIASSSINAFIAGIRDADARTTLKLSTGLADGLARTKFLYTCYIAKVSLVDFCVEHCKNGTGTLANIFASGQKHFETNAKECHDDVGVSYYSLSDMQYSLNKRAPKENFSSDCILNSKSKKEKVCRLWDVQRYEKPRIQSEEGLSSVQVDYFVARCPPHVLTSSDKRTICFARSFGATDEAIYNRKILPRSVTLAQIKAVKCSK